MRTRKHLGVTLLELVFSMGLLALLAGLAVPGFRSSLRAAAVRSATFELLAGVQQARANSILESRPGLLCPTDSAGTCLASGQLAGSWRAYLATDPGATEPGTTAPGETGPGASGAGQRELGGQVLPRGVMVHSTRSPLRFWPTAFAASPGTLTICDMRNDVPPRAIVISQSGRARLARGSPAACAA
jgi:type IV fimbrial biogenesis protein FimT